MAPVPQKAPTQVSTRPDRQQPFSYEGRKWTRAVVRLGRREEALEMLLQDLHDDRVGWVAGTILVAPTCLLGRGRRLWMRTRAGLRHLPPWSKAGANPGTTSLTAYPRSSSLRRVRKRDSACPIVGLQRAANVSVTSRDGRALVSASRQGTEAGGDPQVIRAAPRRRHSPTGSHPSGAELRGIIGEVDAQVPRCRDHLDRGQIGSSADRICR